MQRNKETHKGENEMLAQNKSIVQQKMKLMINKINNPNKGANLKMLMIYDKDKHNRRSKQ